MQRSSQLILALCAVSVLWVTYATFLPNPLAGGSVELKVAEGTSFAELSDTLESLGLIRDPLTFGLYARLTGHTDEIRAGIFTIERGLSHAGLLGELTGEVESQLVKVTFPEGVTVRRIGSIAAEKLGLDSARIVELATDREFLSTIGLTASTAEGYLMPDTYFFEAGGSEESLLEMMAALFLRYYNDERKNKASDIGLTPYEAIILASLVEGEARVAKDRPIVAGLYLNRLRIGMRLQADPTIQYILPDGPRRLLYEDLEIDSPYNTYRYAGLPPTPINSPGRASIEATLNPTESEYIYMVARGDGSGEHIFSTNKTDHDRAVAQYRRNMRRQRNR